MQLPLATSGLLNQKGRTTEDGLHCLKMGWDPLCASHLGESGHELPVVLEAREALAQLVHGQLAEELELAAVGRLHRRQQQGAQAVALRPVIRSVCFQEGCEGGENQARARSEDTLRMRRFWVAASTTRVETSTTRAG